MDYQQLIQRNLKKITIGLAIVGVASLTIWYLRNQSSLQSESPIGQISNDNDVDNMDDSKEDLVSASKQISDNSQSKESKAKKKKKKKIDAQARMQKLLAKQNKRHGQSQNDSNTSPDYQSDDNDDLDQDSKDWKEFVQLLSIKGTVYLHILYFIQMH